MSDPALTLRGVSAGYGETVVLEGVEMTVAQGESVSIIGRNGVGKSTLLGTVMGHTTLHRGAIAVSGTDITALPIHGRVEAGLGFVPQEREIFPSLSVEENLEIAVRSGDWNVDRVYDLFPNLKERRTNGGNQLSGGEQQMLAIGRALVGNPKVLLMDEPSEGLAPVIVQGLQEAMSRLKMETGLTIILVEQNSRVALGFAERCLVMNRGRIIHDGASDKLREDEALLHDLIGVG